MTILVLGPKCPQLIHYIRSLGDDVISTERKITGAERILHGADWLVSYGYRYLIGPEELRLFPRRAINLHISYLPFNRGADPNLWSFLEDTPKGVSIHYIDERLDTGDILAQREVFFGAGETLRSSYDKLNQTLLALFMESWPEIRLGRRESYPQPAGGSCHKTTDRRAVEHLLLAGWDTPVIDLIGRAPVKTTGEKICSHPT